MARWGTVDSAYEGDVPITGDRPWAGRQHEGTVRQRCHRQHEGFSSGGHKRPSAGRYALAEPPEQFRGNPRTHGRVSGPHGDLGRHDGEPGAVGPRTPTPCGRADDEPVRRLSARGRPRTHTDHGPATDGHRHRRIRDSPRTDTDTHGSGTRPDAHEITPPRSNQLRTKSLMRSAASPRSPPSFCPNTVSFPPSTTARP